MSKVVGKKLKLRTMRGKLLEPTAHCLLMGIVNCTPDSFSGDGLSKKSLSVAIRYVKKMIKDGADIIDIGGFSSRPGAATIKPEEELSRIVPLIKSLKNMDIVISVDTSSVIVAKEVLSLGVCIINVIDGVNVSEELLKAVAHYDAHIVLMHKRGTPRTMMQHIQYKDVVKDIVKELQPSFKKCLDLKIKKDKIILDPGIGFAKSFEQNISILSRIKEFQSLGYPVMIGISRKSMIGQLLNGRDVNDRLSGSLALSAIGAYQGINIIRVHDVRETRDVLKVVEGVYARTRRIT